MDVKMMHEMIEKLTECAKAEMDKKGIEELDAEEFGKATDIIKDLAEAMYYRTLTEAMKEAEYGEEYDEYGPMDDGRRGYRGQPRDSRGRYMSRGDGRRSNRGRRGYEEPWDEMYDEMEYMRDMDIPRGRMGYTGSGSTGSGSNSSGMSGNNSYGGNNNVGRTETRDSREGKSGQMRRGYMEAKEMGKDKQEKMKELENYMKELSSDVTEMISDASPEEKSMLKQKMQVLMTKIQ